MLPRKREVWLPVALVSALAACQTAARPPRPPPTPGPATRAVSAPPPHPLVPAPREAGKVELSTAMLVGGHGMTDEAIDAATGQLVAAFDAGVFRFRRCYASALQHRPDLSGTITAHVVIAGDGSLYDLQRKEVALPDPRMVDCVFDAFRKLTYAPHAGQLFAADAPVSFTPR